VGIWTWVPGLYMFLTFRDLQDIKWTKTFCHAIFLGNRRPWEEEVNRERDEAGIRGHHMGPHVCYMVIPTFPLVRCFDTILESTDSSSPKINYIKDALGDFAMEAAKKYIIHETDLKTAWIGGRHCQSHSRLSLRLHRHHILQQHDEEEVVHPLDYGDCGSN
jgi:hypothetical protein